MITPFFPKDSAILEAFPSDALAQYEQNQLRLAYFRPFSFADKQNQCFKDSFVVYFLLWLAFVTIRQFVFVNL